MYRSITDIKKKGFKVSRFGHGRMYGVIRILKTLYQQTQASAATGSGFGHQSAQNRSFQMV